MLFLFSESFFVFFSFQFLVSSRSLSFFPLAFFPLPSPLSPPFLHSLREPPSGTQNPSKAKRLEAGYKRYVRGISSEQSFEPDIVMAMVWGEEEDMFHYDFDKLFLKPWTPLPKLKTRYDTFEFFAIDLVCFDCPTNHLSSVLFSRRQDCKKNPLTHIYVARKNMPSKTPQYPSITHKPYKRGSCS